MIKKRFKSDVCKCMIRNFYEDKGKRIITQQTVLELRVRSDGLVLFGGDWIQFDKVNPDERGGVEYEIYRKEYYA
jgi:hypothetical protein